MESWGDLPEFLRMIAALVFVLGLMGGFALVLKKIGLSNTIQSKAGRDKRLSISEVLPLDARRRLVLVRRDDVEHLVIIGGQDETVIETGIATTDNRVHED